MNTVYGISYGGTRAIDPGPASTKKATKKKSTRRLSKPRTVSSSANLKPHLSLGDLSNLTRSAAASVGDLLSPSVDKSGPRSADSRDPDHFTRTAHSEQPERDDKDGKSGKDGQQSAVVRLQRSSTKLAARLSVRRPPTNQSASTLLMQDFDQAPSEDYEWLKEQAMKDRQTMRNHRPGTGSEEAQAEIAPLRRKSLMTPGLATRGDDVLKKQSDSDLQARYYNAHLSPGSPLARIAALDVPGRSSFCESFRAATPSERDYGQIGGLLRIANGGAISPSLASLGSPNFKSVSFEAFDSIIESGWYDASSYDGNSVHDLFSPVDAANVYDTYAADAGNPWETSSVEDTTNMEILDKQPHNQQFWTPGKEYQEYQSFEKLHQQSNHQTFSTGAAPSRSSGILPPQQQIRQRASYYPSPAPRSTEIRHMADLCSTNARRKFQSPLEVPVLQPKPSRPPLNHRPDRGVTTLGSSRIEMARVLDSMMAASRYTPMQDIRSDEEWPSSAASDMPSLSWGRSQSNSTTSTRSNPGDFPPGAHEARPEPFELQTLKELPPIPTVSPLEVRTPVVRTPAVRTPAVRTPMDKPNPVMTFITDTSNDSSSLPVSPAAPDKRAKPAAKKLQKRRPKSMPAPVERIVVSGHEAADGQDSPIPKIPPALHTRVAERWQWQEDKNPEPIFLDQISRPNADYFSQKGSSVGLTSNQFSPNAPRVPEKSTARPLRRPRSYYQPDDSSYQPVDRPSVEQARPSTGEFERRKQYKDPPLHYQGSYGHPSIVQPDNEIHERSHTGQRLYIERPLPATPMSKPRHLHHYSADSLVPAGYRDRMPNDWSLIQRDWTKRREDANERLQTQTLLARKDPKYSVPVSPRHEMNAPITPKYRTQATQYARGNGSENVSPWSQPSAAPSPLRQALHGRESGPADTSKQVSPSRHLHQSSGADNATGDSFFPQRWSFDSGAAGLESDVDADIYQSDLARNRMHKASGRPKTIAAGRYEGGLDFGYERGRGVGGSAGTRGVADRTAARKAGTGNMSVGFGVDLSDVPIFITKTRAT